MFSTQLILLNTFIIFHKIFIMGLLGNKDNKSTTKETPVSPKVAEVAPTITQNSNVKSTLQEWISSTKSCINSWTSAPCQWYESSSEVQEIKRFRKEFANHFCHPLAGYYRSFPVSLTSWKFSLIDKFSQKERLLALEGLSLLVAVASLRIRGDIGLSKRILFSIRNSGIGFMMGGLLIAPEIYNPLIKSDF